MIYNQAKNLIFEHIDNHHSQTFLIEGGYKSGQKSLTQDIIQHYIPLNSPDITWIAKSPDSSSLGLKDIQSIKQNIYNSPLYHQYNFCIIEDADFLNKEAQNALLKLIEEPGEHSIIILLGVYHQLLPTIYSRCLSVYIDNDKAKDIYLGHRDLVLEIEQNIELKQLIDNLWISYIGILQKESLEIFAFTQDIDQYPIELVIFIWESIHWLCILATTDKTRYTNIRLSESLRELLDKIITINSLEWHYTALKELDTLKKTLLFSNRKNTLAIEQFLLSIYP
jgi:DNA polymerase III delta prime subunit